MSYTILFVDDDVNILNGFKRVFSCIKNDWNFVYINNGIEALTFLENNKVDIIISDMRMPYMDGFELLNLVKLKYPHILRIILTGFSEKEVSMKISFCTHQFLVKPCDPNLIKKTIQRMLFLKDILNNEELMKTLNSVNQLPSLPELYIEIEKEMGLEFPSIKRISDIVGKDISMTAKLLQIVNSVVTGIQNKVTSISVAINILGIESLKTLILFEKIFSTVKTIPIIKPCLDNLWIHSINTAAILKNYTDYQENYYTKDELFIAGLLHDIGKIVVLQLPEFIPDLTSILSKKDTDIKNIDYTYNGITHAQIGAYLLGIWGFTESVVDAVHYHDNIEIYSGVYTSIVKNVWIANKMEKMKELDEKFIENNNIPEQFIMNYKEIKR